MLYKRRSDKENKNMKKIMILIGLIATLASCGGGGGGSASQTGGATPVIPLMPSTPSTPSAPSMPSEPVNPGTVGTPHIPGVNKDPSNSENMDKETFDGKNINVGVAVLDGDFLSKDAKTTHFHLQNPSDGHSGKTFETVKGYEFENRLIALGKNDESTGYSGDDHGLVVASILAGNSGHGVKGLKFYGVSFGAVNNFIIEIEKYKELREKGVKIYNQSFGTPEYEYAASEEKRKEIMRNMVKKSPFENEVQELNERADELIKFYKDSVKEGALFIWAAGNSEMIGNIKTSSENPTLQAALPKYYTELAKGWISVVGVRKNLITDSYVSEFAKAGIARYWSISADQTCGFDNCFGSGSSYAAPKVTAVAVKVKEKFPWMTGHEIQQTILTTADDIGQPGIDVVYGWGYLNEERALKGPAVFHNVLLEGERGENNNIKGYFNANIYEQDMVSKFENDISGEGGLKKSGKGTLVLTGKNSYTGETKIEEGTLEVHDSHASETYISNKGKLVMYPNTVIGRKNYSDGSISPVNVTNDGGILENRGSGAVIAGDYVKKAGSITRAEIGNKLIVKGSVDDYGGTIEAQPMGKYITKTPLKSTVIEAEGGIKGSFEKVAAPELINASISTTENTVDVTVSRKNVKEYVSGISTLADDTRVDVAENIEASFKALDEEIEKGNLADVEKFALKAAEIQAMSLNHSNSKAVLDSMSGHIYGSAQALTFQHSQTINKDLSNRLVMLGTLDNVGDNAGLWVTGIGARGKLKQDGFGSGDTNIFGGQVGVDKKFGNFILGGALSYSTSEAKFDRYGGKSTGDGFGLSVYGRYDLDIPVYLQGRLGMGFITSNVERDILLESGSAQKAKIEHKDKVFSGYVETGYDAEAGGFVITPYVGISHDTVSRGNFTEENSQFGLTASKATFKQTSGHVGLRVGKSVEWSDGSKTTFQGYVSHQAAFNKEDLSFEAAYTGLSGAKFTVKGIGLSRHQTWGGLGVLTEVNPNFAWYINYDGKLSQKGNNNIFTTGFRVNF